MQTIKTTLHLYNYDTDNPKHSGPAGEWTSLEIKLRHTVGRGHWMHSLKPPGERDNLIEGPIELDPECLFQNQWNSDQGRVFDWYQEAVFSAYGERKNIKRGHYLDITEEMIALRRDTLKCGYTGQQFPASTSPRLNTTDQALGSPYLKESELHLLRLLPVCEEWTGTREPLTQEERAFLLPLYLEAQTKATSAQRDKQRAELLKDYDQAITVATAERDGFLWLLDHGIQTENCIYYSHTKEFCFGWRQAYAGEARAKLLELLAKFPFPYDLK